METKSNVFQTWMAEHGADVEQIDIVGESNRCAVVKKNFKKGDTVGFVPLEHMITLEMCKQTKTG
jgi:hypothetical protein